MGTFELNRDNFGRDNFGRDDAASVQANRGQHHGHHGHDDDGAEAFGAQGATIDRRRLKQECIIAFKVYDQCRHLDCRLLH